MAFDDALAQRIGEVMDEQPGIEEKRMFGGLSFMVRGNLACGVIGEDLIVRIGPERYEEALATPHTRPFDFTGRPMRGWIVVTRSGYESVGDLGTWVRKGVEFALTLPPK